MHRSLKLRGEVQKRNAIHKPSTLACEISMRTGPGCRDVGSKCQSLGPERLMARRHETRACARTMHLVCIRGFSGVVQAVIVVSQYKR